MSPFYKDHATSTGVEMKKDMRKVVFFTALVILGLALFSGCALIKGETAGKKIDDASITKQANAIIVEDRDAHYLKISVKTTKGDVVLTGFVNSGETMERLISKIREIKDVNSVTNLLKME